MRLGEFTRRYWPEVLLTVAVVVPWLSLLALGIVWLWQGGHVWRWAIAAAALSLLAWPLSRIVRRRANKEARVALGDVAEPSRGWTTVEQDAWDEVHKIADATEPFAFTEFEPFLSSAQTTIDAVARHFHPHAHTAWAQFSLPEALLLSERLGRDLRHKALEVIPGVRAIKLSHLLWVQRQSDQYGETAQTGWRVGFGLWRMARALLHPLQAVGQETSGHFVEKTATVLSYRLRAHATRLFVLEVGRAAIDLYSGRLALSDAEMRAARERDMSIAAAPAAPVRIVLIGQVSAGKSSSRECVGAGDTLCRGTRADDIAGHGISAERRRASAGHRRRYARARREHRARIRPAGAGRARRPHHLGCLRDAARPRNRSQEPR